MVHLRVQSIICLEQAKKSQIAPPNVIEIPNDRVYGTHLRVLSKMDLRVQMNAKSGQLKNKSESEIVGHLVMHKRMETEQPWMCLICAW